MKINQQPRFVSPTLFQDNNPARATIQRIAIEEQIDKFGKPRKDVQLHFLDTRGYKWRMSLWGVNTDVLVAALGDETDDWPGAEFALFEEQDATGGTISRRIQDVRKKTA